MPSDHHDEHYSNKPWSMRHSGTLSWCRCRRPLQGTHLIPPSPQAGNTPPTHPRVSARRDFFPFTLPTQPNFSGPLATFPSLPRYQKPYFKRMDNLEKVKKRRARMSSQKLAPNLEEKSKEEHCHLENKVWVNFVCGHTKHPASQPQPVGHEAPHQ